jgi:cysteine desulfurase/selenocysteine lyase
MTKMIEEYINNNGFIDVPKIISQGKEFELFPDLLPDIHTLRQKDFPLLGIKNRVYLDSAATSLEPQSVIDRAFEYRKTHLRGNNHSKNSMEAREVHEKLEEVRKKVQDFFSAHNYFIGFTSGTTDTSNWIAARFPFKKDDLILITEAEHNSQILTARNMAKSAGAKIKYLPVSFKEGKLDLNYLKKIVSERKHGKILLNLVHVSNTSGVINPVNDIRKILGNRGFIYLDCAQSAGHIPVNLDKLDVDFAGISAHKMYGPMGIGAVFINKKSKRYVSNKISGGSAIRMVSRNFTVSESSPSRYEPGTQNLEGAIEWGYAIDYLNEIGMDKIEAHDKEIVSYFTSELHKIKGIKLYGPIDNKDRTSVVSFNVGTFAKKNYDKVARELDNRGISTRDGCFCAHIYTARLLGLPNWVPETRAGLMKLGVSERMLKPYGAVRTSFAFYNTLEDAYKTVMAIKEIAGK